MEITKERLLNIFNLINGQAIEQKRDKLSYAVQRFAEKNKKPFTELQKEIADINLKHASTDKEGNLLVGEKTGYVFTKEASKSNKADIDELLKQTAEVEPFICHDLKRVRDLDPFLIEQFSGLLFEYTVEDYYGIEKAETLA